MSKMKVSLEGEVGIFVVGIDREDLLEALGRKVGLEELLLLQLREVDQRGAFQPALITVVV